MKKSELIQILGQPEDTKVVGLLLFKGQDSETIRQLKSILKHPYIISLPSEAPLPSRVIEAMRETILEAMNVDSRTQKVLDNLRLLLPVAAGSASSSSSADISPNSNAVEKMMQSKACNMNVTIINKYKQKIRQLIKSQGFGPSPEMVLNYLLKDYITGVGLPGFQFVKSLTSSHTKFANQLITSFKQSDFDLLKLLDDYLSKKKLEINGDFFALLLAYFDYYGSQYEFSEFTNVKKQIFIPLHVYHQKIATEQINSYLAALMPLSTFDHLEFESMNSENKSKYLESENLKLHDLIYKFSLITNLEFLSGNKSSVLVLPILNLLNRIEQARVLAGRGIAYKAFIEHAFKVLCAISIPEELQLKVVDGLLFCANSEQFYSEMRESACKALGIIPLPVCERQIVISNLLQLAGSTSWPMRKNAWEALEKIGVSEKDKMEFINERLKSIKQFAKHPEINLGHSTGNLVQSEDKQKSNMLDDALMQLATMGDVSIPEEMKSEIVFAVLNINYSKCPAEFYLFVKYFTPASLKDKNKVIDRLLADFKTQRSSRISYIIEAIDKLNPSGEKLVEVLREFIKYLRLHPQDSYSIFKVLSNTNIPKEIRSDARDALIRLIPNAPPARIDNVACALVNVGIPEDQFAQLLSQASNAVRASQYEEGDADVYAAFSKADIPPETRNSFIEDLIERIGCSSVDRALGEMDLTYGECIKVMNALLKKLAEQENNDAIGIIETLVKLQKYIQPHESVAIKIKLEEMIPTIPEKTSHLIMPYMKEFDKLCDIKMQLAQKLPRELIPDILIFR